MLAALPSPPKTHDHPIRVKRLKTQPAWSYFVKVTAGSWSSGVLILRLTAKVSGDLLTELTGRRFLVEGSRY